uniref:Uncharacterized protein n=1 Tax=Cannabis sativa TaxID=3483 RepID=A0A803R4Y0_CANSA
MLRTTTESHGEALITICKGLVGERSNFGFSMWQISTNLWFLEVIIYRHKELSFCFLHLDGYSFFFFFLNIFHFHFEEMC